MNQVADLPCSGSGSRTREILIALLHAATTVETRVERTLEPWGLSMAKMGALGALVAAGGPLPLGQLAERLCCVKSNVTQLVDRLETDGLVRRTPDPADRRSVLAVVTPEGRARYEAAAQARADAEAALLADLSEEELALLEALFRKVAARAG